MTRLSPLVLLGLLAGCGAATLTEEEVEYQDRLSAAEALTDSIASNARFNVVDGNLADNGGTGLYQGFVEVAVDTPTQTSILGDATIVANFGSRTITGALENFVGSVNGGITRDFGTDVINMTGGSIPNRPDGEEANWGAVINGALSEGTDAVIIVGSVAGRFRAETASGGPVAIEGESASGTTFQVITPTLNQTFNDNGEQTQVEIVAATPGEI